MTRLAANEARKDLAEALNRVAYGKERIVLQRRGKDVAALVSLEDLAVLEEIEDRMDLEEARAALREKGSVRWETLRKKLGI